MLMNMHHNRIEFKVLGSIYVFHTLTSATSQPCSPFIHHNPLPGSFESTSSSFVTMYLQPFFKASLHYSFPGTLTYLRNLLPA